MESGSQYFLYNKLTAYRPTNKNRIKIVAVGSLIQIYINGSLQINYNDTNNPVLSAGKVALQTYFSHAHFDNVKITSGTQIFNYDFNTDDSEFIFGYGWTHSYFLKIKEYSDHITLIRENNSREFYKPNGDGTYTPVVETYTKITKDASGFSVRSKYGNHYRFNLSGRLQFIEDRNLNRTTLTYTLSGGKTLLTSVQEPAGRTISFQYGANLMVSQATDPQGNFLQYFYDVANHLVKVIDRNGNQTIYTYDPVTHNLIQLLDPMGNVYKYSYVYNDRVVTQTDPLGNVTTFDYLWSTVHVINKRSQIYMYNFDSNLHLQSIADPLNLIERTVNDTAGNILQYFDKNNNQTLFTYDAMGNRTSIQDPIGNKTMIAYDLAFNFPKTITDARGSVTTFAYDAKGNLLQTVNAAGGVTTFTYNAYGQPLSMTDPRGKITTFTYDFYGNLATRKDPLGNVTAYTFDILGRLTTATDALLNATAMTYDKDGNILTVKDPLINVTTLTYTKNNKVASVSDPLGNVTLYTYDCFGNLLTVTDALGKITSYTYDTANQMHLNKADLLMLKDAKGNSTNYSYDPLDRLTKITDALSLVTQFVYDNQGDLISRTDASARITNYQYDATNRLKKTIYPDSTFCDFTFDPVGNVTQLQDWNGTLQFTYDKLNRVMAKTYPDLVRLDDTYDLNGNRTSLNIPGYGKILYTYDAANRLVKTTTPDGRAATFTYDKLSRRTKLVYPNGSSATYTYDAASRLQQVLNADKNAVNVSKAVYVYDADSRRTRADYLSGSLTYTYDKLSQLVKEQGTLAGLAHSVAYAYDPLGNRTSVLEAGVTTTYTNNALNQVTKTVIGTGTVVYTYDKNGNLIGSQNPNATDASKFYAYDFENRLNHYGGGFSVPAFADYTYNGLGERTSKTLASQQPTSYYYDLSELILEKKGTALTTYVHGPTTDELLVDSRGYSYHTDGQGSVMALTDNNGLKANTYSYSAFGLTKSQTGTVVNSWQYTGRQFDSETGLYFNRNRYYNPWIGRFMTQDPIGIRGGVNLYGYVQNSPVNLIDPSGLTWETNAKFLGSWLTGSGSSNRVYSENSTETQEMASSQGAQQLRNAFAKANYESVQHVSYDTFSAARDTLINPATADWSRTAAQVGGFANGSAINNGNGTVTYTIPNVAGTHSFFYHVVPDQTSNAWPVHNVKQTFSWTEDIPDSGMHRSEK